jgi:MerR family transcriptional regulator, heat shock protein HspR
MARQPTSASASLLKLKLKLKPKPEPTPPPPPADAQPAEADGGEDLPANAAFVISVAARLVGVHEQTLRYYERAGLLEPARSKGRIRLYSLYDLERVRQIRRLTDEMGVNLAGVEVIMRLTDHIRELEHRIDGLQDEVRRVRAASPRTPRGAAPWT